jgi:uncharacterized Fe-S cluster-containing radical SAM superfamily protein
VIVADVVGESLGAVGDVALSEHGKFENPDWTAKGEKRAVVPLRRLETLWINTGTLCNITCRNCYIESSPTNDRLAYISSEDVGSLLKEAGDLGAREIGFTGGEPFLNPDFLDMIQDALTGGFDVLVLTNAMIPMQRPRVKERLLALRAEQGLKLAFRVSLDHFTKDLHEVERGPKTWERALDGIDWLVREGFSVSIAGRTCWNESEAVGRDGYGRLFSARGWPIDAADSARLVLFPEMDGVRDAPEITTACWDILGRRPEEMMCATSRMAVKRKGAEAPAILPCTLLPYEPSFEMGASLKEAVSADGGMFDNGGVKLCHPHCAQFCVLGGGSCS